MGASEPPTRRCSELLSGLGESWRLDKPARLRFQYLSSSTKMTSDTETAMLSTDCENCKLLEKAGGFPWVGVHGGSPHMVSTKRCK